MSKIVIYTTAVCAYCNNAKQLLSQKKLDYTEVRVDTDPEKMKKMIELSGRRTVPQIFINGKPIGGFDDLSALNASGKLDDLLKEGNAS
ncbi:glutaredoxin 3 [Rickettsiella endosymbiont of Dermanyssus gallinae]|uniref:glutaredoxin 3 n=1 Tax=Rickettsiella endosymbiont of Dermanyssus gallinae TaxID=2856608 RepID=UPI001C5296DB|nr:glutaredoxin 3 [Rickettsiella endosymbiont of Dermanyssus gallinae]